MNAVDKIVYFYDNIKIKNAPIVEKAKKSLGVIISAAAVSAVSLIPAIVKKQTGKTKIKKPGSAV